MITLYSMEEIKEWAKGSEPGDLRHKRLEAANKTFGDLLEAELKKPEKEQDLYMFMFNSLLYDDQGNAYRLYRKY